MYFVEEDLAKVLMCVSMLISILFGGKVDMNLVDIIGQATSINVYKSEGLTEFKKGSIEFMNIINGFVDMIECAHEMPAFGVSLHEATIEAMKTGIWVEFSFAETQVHNEMLFDSLLINVEKEWSGFNLIRKYEGKYEGRCFYLNLEDEDMSKLYELLTQ